MATRTIDTNVLVRLLVDDHSAQARLAGNLATQFQLIVLPTVMLETEWVLRSRYRFDRARIVELLRRLVSFERFIVIEKHRVAKALKALESGMDFADALHACFMGDGDTFVTFDRDLVRRASKHIHNVSVELAS
jgi:predicted nucleic-acid-binding protein